MLQILLSLPFAYTIYRFIFGIRAFSQMHILAIFLVLGVGADDIFVLTDAWHQSKRDVKQKPGATVEEQLTRRMTYAYSRTAVAVFNTSFTTAMAFVSTGISPMMSISTFGWFATIAIAVNYLLSRVCLEREQTCTSTAGLRDGHTKKREYMVVYSIVLYTMVSFGSE